jgi:streptogramin lyase
MPKLTWKVVAAVAVIAVVAVSTFSVYEYYYLPLSECDPVRPGTPLVSSLSKVTFGGVTEYMLPSQGRAPNAVTTAPDGSIWFAEQEVPGVAHFYPNNGTLVEYAWPGYPTPQPPDCLYSASVSGIAMWDGKVWAADEYNNAILGVNPADGSTVRINATSNAEYPYWLAVGPDGDLWYTSDSIDTPAALGRISPNGTLSVIELKGMGTDEPLQLTFVNSSLAFLAAYNQAENKTTKTCICNGHIYSFDPSNVTSTMTPAVVGGGFTLQIPTSVSYSDGRIWVAQHLPSSVVSYDLATGVWTTYPTSTVPWSTTLPLAIDANGTRVWFNEHYANKMAVLDSSAGTLTEISESNPPASSGSGIQNDESFAIGNGGIWFTSWSGNYIGFIDGSYAPAFQISVNGNNTVIMSPGQSASIPFRVTGTWSSTLTLDESDSENYGSIPKLIQLTPSVKEIPAGSSPFTLTVNMALAQSIQPGRYVVAVTVTDGGVQQSAYVFLEVP